MPVILLFLRVPTPTPCVFPYEVELSSLCDHPVLQVLSIFFGRKTRNYHTSARAASKIRSRCDTFSLEAVSYPFLCCVDWDLGLDPLQQIDVVSHHDK